jgi:hypothetical protein
MADLDMVFIVEDRDGQVAGMSISLPDLNQVLLKVKPRPGVPEIWSLLKLLWYWKVRSCVDAVRVLALGVLEPYRGRGVDALLIYETTRVGLSKGFRWGEMSWILETNDMMNRANHLMGGEVYKTYRIYQKPLL